jgi:hypothetical protein
LWFHIGFQVGNLGFLLLVTYFCVLQPDQHLQQVMVPHHQNVPPLKELVVLMNQLLLLAEPQ